MPLAPANSGNRLTIVVAASSERLTAAVSSTASNRASATVAGSREAGVERTVSEAVLAWAAASSMSSAKLLSASTGILPDTGASDPRPSGIDAIDPVSRAPAADRSRPASAIPLVTTSVRPMTGTRASRPPIPLPERSSPRWNDASASANREVAERSRPATSSRRPDWIACRPSSSDPLTLSATSAVAALSRTSSATTAPETIHARRRRGERLGLTRGSSPPSTTFASGAREGAGVVIGRVLGSGAGLGRC